MSRSQPAIICILVVRCGAGNGIFGKSCTSTHHVHPEELFGVVEAGLQQLGQVVVLGGADEAGHAAASERTRALVQVVQQNSERLRLKLDYRELPKHKHRHR